MCRLLWIALLGLLVACGGPDPELPDPPDPPDPARDMCIRWRAARLDPLEGTWSGSVAGCVAGALSDRGRENVVKRVNGIRSLAGLDAVVTDPERDRMAQACALIFHATGAISHTPDASWGCFSADGRSAAMSSNLATTPAVQALDLYMTDDGNLTTLGHRRWILNNRLGPIGVGSTSGYSCLWVLGGTATGGNMWTAWPPPGLVPGEIFASQFGATLDDTGWSIQTETLDFSNVSVEVTSGLEPRPVTVRPLDAGFGSASAFAIVPDGWRTESGKTYRVRVSGLLNPIEYEFTRIDCQPYYE